VPLVPRRSSAPCSSPLTWRAGHGVVLGELDAHMRRHVLDPPLRGPGIGYQQAVAMREFVVDWRMISRASVSSFTQ
jgi:hypothetical protein